MTASRQNVATEISPADAKKFITARLARRERPKQIADDMKAHLGIEIESEQVIPFWTGQIALPTQTERRQDKESAQFPEDEVKAPIFTRIADDETPEAMPAPFSITADDLGELVDGARAEAAPTQSAHRQDADSQDADSLQIPMDVRDDPDAARHAALEALGEQVKARLGIAPDPKPTAQTGRRQNQKRSVLTDEMKTFIVKGLARYETPSRVAASVSAEFGIAIDRRQVFAYDPAGSRPPAQRWIDLHAATRAKFLRALSEIGVAQKVVRLRMLDRLANRADEANQTERVLKLLEQAAKECGGFYERYARPKVDAAHRVQPRDNPERGGSGALSGGRPAAPPAQDGDAAECGRQQRQACRDRGRRNVGRAGHNLAGGAQPEAEPGINLFTAAQDEARYGRQIRQIGEPEVERQQLARHERNCPVPQFHLGRRGSGEAVHEGAIVISTDEHEVLEAGEDRRAYDRMRRQIEGEAPGGGAAVVERDSIEVESLDGVRRSRGGGHDRKDQARNDCTKPHHDESPRIDL